MTALAEIIRILRRALGRVPREIEPHPNLGSDRGERAFESGRMEADARHVGHKAPGNSDPAGPGGQG